MNVKVDHTALEVIEDILKRGNDVRIKRKKDSYIILEESEKIKYNPCQIGDKVGQ